jgi:hypothetical protein
MNGSCVFRVESVQDGGCTHAHNGALPHKDVECGQAAQQIWLLCCVDAVPNSDEAAVLELNVKLLTGHDRQQLRGGSEPANILQNCYSVGVHRGSMLKLARVREPPWG